MMDHSWLIILVTALIAISVDAESCQKIRGCNSCEELQPSSFYVFQCPSAEKLLFELKYYGIVKPSFYDGARVQIEVNCARDAKWPDFEQIQALADSHYVSLNLIDCPLIETRMLNILKNRLNITNLLSLKLHNTNFEFRTNNDVDNKLLHGIRGLELVDVDYNDISEYFTSINSMIIVDTDLGNSIRSLVQRIEHVKQLHLENVNIHEIDEMMFVNCPKILDLDLSMNSITKIESRTFEHLQHLVALNLRENKIIQIDENAFVNLPFLKWIDLSDNHFEILPEKLFKNNAMLKELHIGSVIPKNNSFLDILGQYLLDAKSLRCIEVNNLNLTNLNFSVLKFFPHLVHLQLISTGITEIPDESFTNYWGNLTVLDLSGNLIDTITTKTFEGLCGLTSLSLANNLINSIEEGAFVHLGCLKELDLSGVELPKTSRVLKLLQGLDQLQKLNWCIEKT